MENEWSQYVLSDLSTLKGKKVLVRVDLNLPVANGKITDTTRLDDVIPFIKNLVFAGAKVILLSHFGEKGESIQPVADILSRSLQGLRFITATDIDVIKKSVDTLASGDVALLENTRKFAGEEDNTPTCARNFASLGELFINDAFSVSHREHASVVGIPAYLLSYLGPTFLREVEHLSKAIHPEKPALLIIGGAKISTKLDLIKRYLDQGVHVFVGGAMVHTILKARGLEIGQSLYEPNHPLTENVYNHPLLLVPIDVILRGGKEVKLDAVPKDGVIVDCGKETIKKLGSVIKEQKTIIVNGPLGLYEEGFLYGTEQMLTLVAQAEDAQTYIGGGDTVLVAEKAHVLSKIGFVSLGGGAMLEYLARGTLPGLHAVTQWK